MGLPMDRLHAPTVASGSKSTYQNGDNKQMSAQELMAEKDRVWSELQALSSVLDSHGVTMNTPLTTFDGYPRPDLDIAQIRTTRARIIRLKNDYKELMEKIDVALQAHWANPTAPAVAGDEKGLLTMERQGQEETASAVSSSSSSSSVGIPFAKVNTVTAGSPASEAGLRVGDRILRFGDVDWRNHEKLSRVAATVQGSEGRVIVVEVVRPSEVGGGQESVSVRVTPRQNWGGRGMLGCLLLPV